MALKCIVVDDEYLALEVIKKYISSFPSLQLVNTFDDAISAVEFLKVSPVDVLFADIQMPDITGLDMVRSLKIKPIVIFTTAFRNYAVESFELEALDYLLKPIDPQRFSKTVSRILEYHSFKSKPLHQPSESIFVYSEYKMVKIEVNDIEYIETFNDYLKIHLVGKPLVQTLMTLKKIFEILPASNFQRIHRSYLVSTEKVRSILNRKVLLISGQELPISDSYHQTFISSWKDA